VVSPWLTRAGQCRLAEFALESIIEIDSGHRFKSPGTGGTLNRKDTGGAKERVSFETNMTTDEESPDGNSVVKTKLELATAVERYHARKFSAKPDKRGALKVNCSSTAKKAKNPHQDWHAGGAKGAR
jgi:hypothetical protein